MTDFDGIARYLFEAGNLKRIPRAGWLFTQVQDPESVAEHSHRTAVIAMVLAALEGADANRAAALAVLHDAAETRIGDIPFIGRKYLQAASAETITADQTAGMPVAVAEFLAGTVAEFEAKDSPKARCASDADKLECLVQAVEYQHSGYRTEEWIANSRASLRTESARQIAEAALTADPLAWQRNRPNASLHLPRHQIRSCRP
ncbi:HD domain-containing protein [Glycomyces tritici]|uniref:5'-deoxynucleotidase n=1 Tax=Glycomyces tritici TaxID=2665176 RepID=A0ABT7YWM3_9ACTN|nr:HD domain-containing protein [Glycomyces tritici]MDN3243043.1 HD domain-containing protein [Glycomyces tritici]